MLNANHRRWLLRAWAAITVAVVVYAGGYWLRTEFDPDAMFARADGLRTFRSEAERRLWWPMVMLEGWARGRSIMTTIADDAGSVDP